MQQIAILLPLALSRPHEIQALHEGNKIRYIEAAPYTEALNTEIQGIPLANLWRDILESWPSVVGLASDQLLILLASAFLAGALAAAVGARLSILAAAMVAGIWLAQHLGLFDALAHLGPVLAAVFCLGPIQALSNLILGKNQTGALIWMCLTAVLILVVWKIPKFIAVSVGLFPFSGGRK